MKKVTFFLLSTLLGWSAELRDKVYVITPDMTKQSSSRPVIRDYSNDPVIKDELESYGELVKQEEDMTVLKRVETRLQGNYEKAQRSQDARNTYLFKKKLELVAEQIKRMEGKK